MSETYTNNVGRSDYRLPTVNANDNGKILKVVEGEWKKAEGGGGSSLPEYGESDAGKVLKVAEGGESIEWGEAGGGGGMETVTATWVIDYSHSMAYIQVPEPSKAQPFLVEIPDLENDLASDWVIDYWASPDYLYGVLLAPFINSADIFYILGIMSDMGGNSTPMYIPCLWASEAEKYIGFEVTIKHDIV